MLECLRLPSEAESARMPLSRRRAEAPKQHVRSIRVAIQTAKLGYPDPSVDAPIIRAPRRAHNWLSRMFKAAMFMPPPNP